MTLYVESCGPICRYLWQINKFCGLIYRPTAAKGLKFLGLGQRNASLFLVSVTRWEHFSFLFQSLDGDIYDNMQELVTLFANTEMQSAKATGECFQVVMADSVKVRLAAEIFS